MEFAEMAAERKAERLMLRTGPPGFERSMVIKMEEKPRIYRWKRLAILFILLLFVGGFFLFFRVTSVEVAGNSYYTEEEIKDFVMGSLWDYNSLLLYIKYRYIGIQEIPFIQKITVSWHGNNQVEIRVYEKTLTASVKYMGQYIYFDKDGVVLECLEEPADGVPCIEGLSFSSFVLYDKLQVEDEAVFHRILDLTQLLSRYELDIERIRFTKEEEVVLRSGDIRVFLGSREFYDESVAALAEILPKALEQNLSGEIDMANYSVGDEVILKKRDY